MKILIIGGGGIIGSGLSKLLLEEHEVLILDNFVVGTRENVPSGCKVITGNATSFSILNNVFSSFNPEVVFQLADHSQDVDGVYDFLKESDTAVNITTNLCRCIQMYGLKHLFVGSSAEVYTGGSKRRVSERSPTEGVSYTGRTKLYTEDILRLLKSSSNFSLTFLRFFHVYGNRYFINPKFDVVSLYIDSLLKNYQIGIAGPNIYVDQLSVNDAVLASYTIFKAVLSGSELNEVNIGSSVPVKLLDLYNKVLNKMDLNIKPLTFKPSKHTRSLVCDNSKLKSLGWEQKSSLDEDLDNLIKFRSGRINVF